MNEPTCQYLVWTENHDRQVECGLTAEFVSGKGLHYCKTCAERAEEHCRWRRAAITLKPIKEE